MIELYSKCNENMKGRTKKFCIIQKCIDALFRRRNIDVLFPFIKQIEASIFDKYVTYMKRDRKVDE